MDFKLGSRKLRAGVVERRASSRFVPKNLLARYWTGGASSPRQVKDCGLGGALIVAPEVFYLGTYIHIGLEDPRDPAGRSESYRFGGAWGEVVRQFGGGFCVAFVFETSGEQREFRRFLEEVKRRDSDETDGGKSKVLGSISG